MKIKLFFLLFTLTVFSQSKIKLQTGDIIFQKMNCGELCDAIHAVTKGYKDNDFSHLGLVLVENDSVFVIEAGGNAVRKVTLEQFSTYTKTTMFVGRLKRKYREYIPQAINFSLNQIGVPYDDDYLYDNGKYYCSELIYDAFLYAYEKPFFELFPMTFKQPGKDEFFPVWIRYYENLDIKIPEGEPGCNPGGISTSDKLKIIGTIP